MRANFTDRNVRRVAVLLVFLAAMYFFRHLLLLLVFFVIFERSIGLLAGYASKWTGMKFKHAVLLVLLMGLGTIGALAWFGVSTLMANLARIREGANELVDTIRHSDLYHRYGHLGGSITPGRVLEQVSHHASSILYYAAEVGRIALYVVMGLIFAVVFLMEREELEGWREGMRFDSLARILLRYLGYTSDAIAITVKLQVIVAIVNTLLTLPVLLALRLPGIPALMAMLVVTGLIPVVGGVIAGAVLMTVAYVTRGPVGLALFVGSTFVLHKIESYYLNPRLTAKHVKLPGLVIITSLVLFEHAFGLIGLFISFPCLYVAAKIRESWIDPEDEIRDEEEAIRSMRGELPVLKTFHPKARFFTNHADRGEPEAGSAPTESAERPRAQGE